MPKRKKTKIMTTGPLKELTVEGTEMEIINSCTFLGSIITRDGYEHKEINRRLAIERMANDKTRKNYEG